MKKSPRPVSKAEKGRLAETRHAEQFIDFAAQLYRHCEYGVLPVKPSLKAETGGLPADQSGYALETLTCMSTSGNSPECECRQDCESAQRKAIRGLLYSESPVSKQRRVGCLQTSPAMLYGGSLQFSLQLSRLIFPPPQPSPARRTAPHKVCCLHTPENPR